MRAALASHLANICQNLSGFLSIACLCFLMTAAATALIALTAPALSAPIACGLRTSSRTCAGMVVVTPRALVGIDRLLMHPSRLNEHYHSGGDRHSTDIGCDPFWISFPFVYLFKFRPSIISCYRRPHPAC